MYITLQRIDGSFSGKHWVLFISIDNKSYTLIYKCCKSCIFWNKLSSLKLNLYLTLCNIHGFWIVRAMEEYRFWDQVTGNVVALIIQCIVVCVKNYWGLDFIKWNWRFFVFKLKHTSTSYFNKATKFPPLFFEFLKIQVSTIKIIVTS